MHFHVYIYIYLMCKKLNIEPIIICCLTNYGAGLKKEKIDHKDVLINANKSIKII